MHQHGGLFHFSRQQVRQGLERTGNALIDGHPVVQRGLLQYPVDDLGFDAWMANSQSQTPVVVRSKLGVNVAQTVVSGVTTAKLQLGLARNDIQLVVGDQYFLRLYLEKTSQGAD